MAALSPAVVVPGHAAPGTAQDTSQITYSQAYLARFEQELPKAANSAALVDALKQAYPGAGLGIALAYFEGLLRDGSAVFDSEPPITAVPAADTLGGRGAKLRALARRAHAGPCRRKPEACAQPP